MNDLPSRELLVLGVGNLLLGDEGVGVHVVRRLEREGGLPDRVRLVDGGTGGFHLMSLLSDYDPVLFVDASLDGRAPGAVSVLEPRFASDFPRVLSAHDIGLRDLIEAASLVGQLPRMFLVTVSVAPDQPTRLGLSPPVEAAVDRVVREVEKIVERELSARVEAGYPLGRGGQV